MFLTSSFWQDLVVAWFSYICSSHDINPGLACETVQYYILAMTESDAGQYISNAIGFPSAQVSSA